MNFVILLDRKIEGGSKKRKWTATRFLVTLTVVKRQKPWQIVMYACIQYNDSSATAKTRLNSRSSANRPRPIDKMFCLPVLISMIAHACSEYSETVFLRCEKLPEVKCTHRRDMSQNLSHIKTMLQLEAIVEIATNFSY